MTIGGVDPRRGTRGGLRRPGVGSVRALIGLALLARAACDLQAASTAEPARAFGIGVDNGYVLNGTPDEGRLAFFREAGIFSARIFASPFAPLPGRVPIPLAASAGASCR